MVSTFLDAQVQIGADIDGSNSGEQSGWSVDLSADGNIIAIGAPTNSDNEESSGQVRIYKNQSGSWIQVGQALNGESAGDQFGTAVSISADGSIVAIGAPRNDGNGNDSGHVRVFENDNGIWVQIGGSILGESSFNRFGTALSLSSDGNIIAVGAPFNSGSANASGHVRVFENDNGIWVQVGQDIDGEASDDFSGEALSMSADGTIVAIGAPRNNGNGTDSGHVRIYENQSGAWVQIGQDIDGENFNDQSGSAVSLSSEGKILAIGATFNNTNGANSGHVRIFENQSNNWVQIGNSILGEFFGDLFGWSVSLSSDGTILAISAPGHSGSQGHVKMYQNQSSTWVQIGDEIEGEIAGDFSGRSVSLSSDGQEIAIGANRNSGDAGHVRVYDLSNLLSSDDFVLDNFRLYPNPAIDRFIIDLPRTMQLEQINIYNSLGLYLSSFKEKEVDTSSLSAGLYLVEIKTNKGKATIKLVIE